MCGTAHNLFEVGSCAIYFKAERWVHMHMHPPAPPSHYRCEKNGIHNTACMYVVSLLFNSAYSSLF